MTINRLDKPRKLTRALPVTRRTLPVITNEQRSLQRVIHRLTGVIRFTPVRNEAYLSGKPLLLCSDRADQGFGKRKVILRRGQGSICTPLILSLKNPPFLCRP
jgi:hypothetical protein